MASAAHAESVLYTYLTDAEALDVMAAEGMFTERSREIIPTEAGRKLVAWSLQVYFNSGRKLPPTREAIVETWADEMESASITLGDGTETDSIQWAIEQLRAHHLLVHFSGINGGSTKEMKAADPDLSSRLEILDGQIDKLVQLRERVRTRRSEMDGFHGLLDAQIRYDERVADGHVTRGLTFGIDCVDKHTYGVHPGEIATISSRSGTGKSWFAGFVAVNEWRRGRKVLLCTLENDVQMTYDRLACIATGCEYEQWQRGEVPEEKVDEVRKLVLMMETSLCRPLVAQLPMEERTPSAVVRKAILEEVDSLIIDQLSFLHPDSTVTYRARHEQVKSIMFRLKELIDGGSSRKLPLLLVTQLNREGAKAVAKGEAQQEHAAESAAVEQTSDTFWLIDRSGDHVQAGTAELHELKSRRTPLDTFVLDWHPEFGVVTQGRSGQGTENLTLR